MYRFVRLALVVAEMSSVPIAGYLIEFDSHQSGWEVRRSGASQVTTLSDDSSRRQFRFRVPKLGEIRDLIPKPRLPSPSENELRSTSIDDWGRRTPRQPRKLAAALYDVPPVI
jgi:hypothetical protein